ncbi:hypothetical protein HK104_000926 [Borealophlyctis nickersoniae]|nr:hypothetical protein HK104_000926 [Borealophlyctis nickersoniae]
MSVTETTVTVPGLPVDVHILTLAGSSLHVTLSSYGATVTHLIVRDAHGAKKDIIAGFDTPEEYIRYGEDPDANPYFGCVHGGKRGFDKRFWTPAILRQNPPTVRFTYKSRDGEENYPGTLDVSVTYTLTNGELHIEYSASLDESNSPDLQTIVNLTSHPYFNLSGFNLPTVKTHTVYMPRNKGVLELTENQVPTGRILKVADHPELDFTSAPKPLGEDLDRFPAFRGYDHFFLLRDPTPPPPAPSSTVKPHVADGTAVSETPDPLSVVAARATCKESGITLEIRTDAIGFQMYTANWLNVSGHIKGVKSTQRPHGERARGEVSYRPHSAVCFEPSAPVDAINHPAWRDTVVIGKGQTWQQTSVWRFVIESPSA